VEAGIALTIEDTLGSDIMTAAIAHLAHSTPERSRLTAADFNSYVTKRTAHGAPERKDGAYAVSDQAGLGIEPMKQVLGKSVLEIA
jgi:L-alanine-DL-glutamate epimerase-like enolase superfamily enzyme